MPTKVWAPGEAVIASDWNTLVQEQVVATFASAAARAAAIPAPKDGMMSYLADVGLLFTYRTGLGWALPPGSVVRSGTVGFSNINTATLGLHDVPPVCEDGLTFSYPVRVFVAAGLYAGYGGSAVNMSSDLVGFSNGAVKATTGTVLQAPGATYIPLPMTTAWDVAAAQNAGFKVRCNFQAGSNIHTAGGVTWWYVTT